MANIPITNLEKLAWKFAKEKHAGQVRKFTGQSYFDGHVQKVNGTVKLYTKDETTLIAALLHDVIEDCYENKWEGYKEIKEIFGQNVANIVLELTSDKDAISHQYEGSKTNYLIYKMYNMSQRALTIKLADRFNNIADAFTASEKFRNSYYKETKAISNALHQLKLTNIQKMLLSDIDHKLDNIQKIFKIKRVEDMK